MAADTFTALLGLIKQGTGNNNNTWGALLNTGDFDEIDLAIAGRNPIATTGGTTDLSASPPPAGPSGAIHAVLDVSGTLASDATIQVPNLSKIWIVNNLCVLAGHALKVKTPSGAAVTIPPGHSRVWCDGNNIIYVGLSTSLRDTQWLGADGTVGAPGISFASEPATGIRRKGTQDITVVIGGADVLEITGTGASTPSIVNVLSPNALQIQGVQVVPPGAEIDYSGLIEPTGWYFTAGQTKTRSTDAALFAAIAPNTFSGVALTGNTHTSTTVDNLTVDLRGMGLIGAFIEGTGITNGTTITAIAATSLTLSQATSGTASGVALRVSPWGLGDGSTTFKLPDRRGTAPFIRDDLNGTAAGKLSNAATGGIDGTKLSATGGEQAHTLSTGELASHQHSAFIRDPPHHHNLLGGDAGSGAPGTFDISSQNSGINRNTDDASTGIHVNSVNGGGAGTDDATAATGGGGSHNTVPPASICNRLIKR